MKPGAIVRFTLNGHTNYGRVVASPYQLAEGEVQVEFNPTLFGYRLKSMARKNGPIERFTLIQEG